MTVQRRLAAILAADVVGFSGLMEADEEGAHRQVKALEREVIEPAVERHHGRVVKTTGDGFLLEFASPVEAVRSALSIQNKLAHGTFQLRIGINLGDVIIEQDGDVYGEGVNIAARLEALCDPGSICISGSVYDQVEGKIDRQFENRGEQQVKNITKPVRMYALADGEGTRSRASKSLPLPDRPSIAVLPFTNISGDPEQEYFADGVVEDLITALSRVKWFFVIARNSSFTYKGKAVDVRRVGQELGVRYVLEGSVRKSGGRVRITGQLIQAATGHHIWADRFDGGLEDIFALQDQITERVVGAIEPSLRVAEIQRARAKPTGSLSAYDLYLRALPEFYRATRDGYERSITLLKEALRLDPDFHAAKGLFAVIYTTGLSQGWTNADHKARALALADEILAQGRDDPTALIGAGFAIAAFRKDYVRGLRTLETALALSPNSAQASNIAGWVCCYMCEGDKAKGYFERAIRLSPLDPELAYRLSGLGFALVIKGEYERALEVLADAIARLPDWTTAYRMKIWALVRLGRIDEARSAAARHLEIDPGFAISQGTAAILSDPALRAEYYAALGASGLPE